MRGIWVSLVLGASTLATASLSAAGSNLLIEHAAMACVPEEDYAVVAAEVSSPASLRSVKLYFRSMLYPDFYYVEMRAYEGVYVGVLPQPSEETREVAYYIEALDDAFESSRSPELVVPVRDPCSQRRRAAAYLGDDGGIVVGATTSGASPLPPGFRALGIVGTITAAGVASSIGGGLSAVPIVVASAAAAGATGAVVLATASETSTTSSAASTSTTTVTAGGTTSSTASTSTATTTASPSSSSTTTTIAAPGTTTSVAPGSTTTTVSATTTTSSSSTSSSSTTTVSTSTTPATTTVPPTVACFTVRYLGLCRLVLDASCSTGAIDTYAWTLDSSGELGGPSSDTGQTVIHHYTLFPFCVGRTVDNVLTVTGPGGSDTVSQTFRFPLLERTEEPSVDGRLTTRLSADAPSVAGTVLINGVARTVTGSAPVSLPFRGRMGSNAVEARIETTFPGTGTWSFELDVSDLAPGSLVADQGELVALEPGRVVFRIDGARPVPIRFRFELRARSR